ncbi:uncharacterized protein EDB91DRAFT_804226 [Suillus paluster]|uniref:uncharacterized protein n=1 Tax=Suillus paluster TaxID=48578 RepID=UPI001B879A49|nr:uncharacterized protein EDB91DRAFT_804226 [Suillus paluster]KAG1729867.1 hypothetical protein EDB91DRAFT_804226 [Suillus paluster]
MVQIPTITITPAEHEEPSSRESVNIGALLEEISEGTAGLGSLLGHASLSSDDCSEHGVADEPRTDDLLLDVSCGQVDDEEEFLGAGGQELHVKCQDHEIRLDAPDPTLPDAIASEPEIHDICSRDFVEGAIKLKSPVTYPPLVPSGEDEEIASIPHKAGYPIDHLTPKESAPGGQPILSEGDAHQKTIPGSTVLRALKWEGIYDNQNVLNLGVVIDVPEPKAPSRCPGTTSSMDESPGDLHRAVQLPLPDSLQATVKIRSSLAPSHSEASGPLSSVQGEDERRVDSLTVLPQENSPDKTCFAPDNEIFMPEGAMETEKSAFVPFVPPSSAPWKKYVNRDSGFPTTMPEASIPRKIPSAEVFLQNVQPSTAPNSKGCPSGVKEGSTKITTYDKLYSVSNSDLAGQESTSKIWDFPKSRTNAPFHRLLSASIHAPSGQPSEPIHHIDVWGATESIPAMSQSRRPPHVVLSKNCPDHRAASFIPQGSATKSALTRSGPPLRLAGRSLEQGDCALNVNFPDPTQSREYMADQCDPIARAHGLPPLRSAGTYATHGSVPPRTVSGANHITAHRDPSTREPIPDWAAEAAAERRSAVIPPNVSLGTSATRVSSLHQPTGTTTLHTPIPRDVMTTGSKHVSSKVTRWAAEVSRVREPAASHILEGSSLDPGEGVQQRPPLLNRKSKTSLSLDDTPAIFPSTTGAAYHGQRSEPSEFAKQKRVAETRRREQTKIFEGQDSSYYEPGCAKMWEDILLEARRMNGDMWRSPSNATVSDFSLSEWFSRGKDPISGEDIERMIHMLQGGHER